MNKPLLFIFLFCTATLSYAQESIIFKSKFSPNKKYKTELKTGSQTELDFIADKETSEQLKSKGIELPIQLQTTMNLSTDIFTYDLKKNGEFPAKMVYNKMTSSNTIKGETTTQEMPYAGMTILGKYNADNKFKVESITGNQISEEMKKTLITMLENVQEQITFPKKPMKIGDTFKSEIPMSIPIQNMKPIQIKVTIEYLLKQINGNVAYFDLKQSLGLDMEQEQFNMTATGTGTGIAEYNIKEQYLTKFTSDLPMDMTMKMDEKMTMRMKMKVTSEQTVTIE